MKRDVFIVTKHFKADISIAAPYYGQPGGGIQIITPKPIKQMIEEGYLSPIKNPYSFK